MPFCVIARYALLEARLRRLPLLQAAVVLLAAALAGYAGALSVTEPRATAAAFHAALARLLLAGLAAGYLILSEMRSLEPDHAPLHFTLPIGRGAGAP